MRKQKSILILIIVILLAAAVGGYFAFEYYKKMKPNDEYISAEEFFSLEDGGVAVLYNHELTDIPAICRGTDFYLPASWVKESLNDKFYWDRSTNSLFYTLPDRIDTPSGYMFEGDELFFSTGLIMQYCDISFDVYTDPVPRIYIEASHDPYYTMTLAKDSVLRTGESIKQRCITDVPSGSTVRILEEGDEWLRVYTDTGYQGYVQMMDIDMSSKAKVEPPHTYIEPAYASISLGVPILLAWHQITHKDDGVGLSNLLKNSRGINVVSPTWFSLSDNSGSCSSLVDDDYISYVHDKGMQVWALVDNFNPEVDTAQVLASYQNRYNLICYLINEALTHGIDGINIDFEQLPESCGEDFTEFIRELSIVCRLNHIILSVDNPNPAPYNLFYNRAAQGECIDYVINMGYDEHYAGGEAGSVSSFPFFAEGLEMTLAEVPADKFIAGIPFYTRLWPKNSSEPSQALGLGKAADWFAENVSEPVWDGELGQYFGETEEYMMWLENEESLQQKIDLVHSKNLAGIACWKLGLERPQTWETLEF